MVPSTGSRRLGLSVTLWVACLVVFVFGMGVAYTLGFGYDSHAYWVAAHGLDHLYDKPPLARDAYLYSPAFVQALWPLAQLPWPAFAITWGAVLAAAFFWLLRNLSPRWFVPTMLACVPEILTGNVYALMAVALVLGVTRGWPWTFPLLTKVTPGLVGWVFLAIRGDLRRLVQAIAATAAVVAVSVLIGPSEWAEWLTFLYENRSSSAAGAIVPLPIRIVGLLVAGGLVVLAARRRAYWALAVAAILVSPTLGPNTLTLLAAVPRLRDAARGHSETPT